MSNPVTRKDLAARTWGIFWYESTCPVLFEIMVQIKQKRGPGVETPHPRSFWCSMLGISCVDPQHTISTHITHHTHFHANEYYTYKLGVSCADPQHTKSTDRGDQTENIWISRLSSFPGFSFELWGLRLLTWNPVGNFGDSRENVFDMYGDSCENLLEILAVGARGKRRSRRAPLAARQSPYGKFTKNHFSPG